MEYTNNKEIVIDGKGHIAGRLAATVAKQALEGTKITIVRAEDIIISGSQFRNRLKFMEFLRKHSNTNRSYHSHIHYRTPSKYFKRLIRGMIPHKTTRGAIALKRITVVDGIPGKWNIVKKVYVPSALKHLCIKQTMPVTRLGDLCSTVGWKADPIIKKFEEKRKEKATEQYKKRSEKINQFRIERLKKIEKLPTELVQSLV